MPKKSSPRCGSLQFYPRKRTKRIYPRVNFPSINSLRISGFAGYKAGMLHSIIVDSKKGSQTKGSEISVPITVIDSPPLSIIALRFYKQNPDGLYVFDEIWDEKVSEDKDLKRKLKIKKIDHKQKLGKIEKEIENIREIRFIVKTQPRKSGIGKKTPEIFEIEVLGNDIKEKWKYSKDLLGKELDISNIFKEGEFIDVSAVTKGKGTQGPVKRFGVKIQRRKAKGKRRHIGTLGSETPRRVIWTVPMAGQLGFFKRTEYNKRILRIGKQGNEITPKSGFTEYGVVKGDYILLEGSIPGSRKRLIILRTAIRPPKTPILTSEIKHIEK